LCQTAQFVSLRIFSPLSDGYSEKPNDVAEDTREDDPEYALLLNVGFMVPEQEGEDGQREVIIASVWTIQEGEEGNSEEVVAEELLIFHYRSTIIKLLVDAYSQF
jgi:hypothetical protein